MAVGTIGVCGAGMMGSEIALVFALAGHKVHLMDMDQAFVDKAMAKLEEDPGQWDRAGVLR